MNKKILIVDDEVDILEPLSLILKANDYIVKTLTSGEKIFNEIADFQPNLILLDILISGTDGREICKQLKKDLKTKNIPVVIMSAHPGAKDDAKSSGSDGFLGKPFDTDDLIDAIESIKYHN